MGLKLIHLSKRGPRVQGLAQWNGWISCSRQSDGLVRERRNSITNTMELRFSCTIPSKLRCHNVNCNHKACYGTWLPVHRHIQNHKGGVKIEIKRPELESRGRSVYKAPWYGVNSEIILWMHPTNERRRYNATSSLIDWAHTQNDP